MKPSSRIADYGITGAFFVVAQVSVFILIDPAGSEQRARAVLRHLGAVTSAAPSLSPSVASLLAAIALILVFFVGLVIDQVGFYAPMLEIVSFRRKLATHNKWVGPLLKKHAAFLGAETSRFFGEYQPPPSTLAAFKEALRTIPFSRRYWRISWRNWQFVRFTGTYQRLLTFMVTLALHDACPSIAEDIRGQLRLWRTLRGIATALVIVAILLLFETLGNPRNFLRMQIVYIISFVLASNLVVRSFRQLCDTVFTALYVGNQPESEGGALMDQDGQRS